MSELIGALMLLALPYVPFIASELGRKHVLRVFVWLQTLG